MFQYDALAIEDINIYRHWHPGSEKYAVAEALATALYLNWKMGKVVYQEDHWHAGVRCACVYHIELERDGEVMIMPVVCNPYVRRLLDESYVRMVPIAERRHLRRQTASQEARV